MSAGARGLLNNNPGNIRHSLDAWDGMSADQTDPGFVRFDTPEAGVRAMTRILVNYNKKQGLNTVEGIISRWSPPSDNNPTESYIKYVSSRLGVGPKQPLNMSDEKTLASLVKAMSRVEVAQELPYTDAQLLTGVRAGITGQLVRVPETAEAPPVQEAKAQEEPLPRAAEAVVADKHDGSPEHLLPPQAAEAASVPPSADPSGPRWGKNGFFEAQAAEHPQAASEAPAPVETAAAPVEQAAPSKAVDTRPRWGRNGFFDAPNPAPAQAVPDGGSTEAQPSVEAPVAPEAPQPGEPTPHDQGKAEKELIASLDKEMRERNPILFSEVRPASPVTLDEQRQAEAELRKTTPGFFEGAGLAATNEWSVSQALAGANHYAPDPDWKLTPERLKELTKDVPEAYWDTFKDAHSDAHAEFLRGRVMGDLESERRLSQMGWTGVGLRLGAAVLDPAALGLTALTEGAAAPFVAGVKLSRLARIVKGGVEGAVIGGGSAAALHAVKPTHDAMDILYAAGGGMALGAAVGRLSRVAPEEAAALQAVGRDVQRVAEAGKAKNLGLAVDESSAGAMEHSYKEALHPDVYDILRDGEEAAPKTAMGGVRWDSVGQLKSSDNPLARAAGALAEDAVGNADRSVSTAYGVSEWVQRMFRSGEARWNRERGAALREWADSQDMNWLQRQRAVKQFDELVTDYARNSNPLAEYHPAVKRLGDQMRKGLDETFKLAGNPGLPEGKAIRGVKGFGEGVDNYVPRIADKRALGSLVDRFGDKNIRKLLTNAIKDAQPDIEHELAKKFAKAWLNTQRRIAAGMEGHAAHAFAGGDMDMLRTLLREQGDMATKDIDSLVELLTPKGDKGTMSRARNRIDMTERYAMQMKDKTGNVQDVSVSDLLVNDADFLFKNYTRSVLGAAGMARFRVANPKALPGEEGSMLVDGITSGGEWQTFLDKVRATSDEIGQKATSRDRDIANLEFIYRGIMGIPQHSGSEKATMQLARMLRDYNVVRVMNQLGFAQLAEIGNITGQLGIKAALQNMPGFSALIRNVKTGKVKTELLDEIESTWGFGAERLQMLAPQHWDEMGPVGTYSGQNRAIATLDNALRVGKRITSDISGFNAVNSYTHAWAASAVIGKFASDALSGTARITNRLRTLGLTAESYGKVLDQLKAHASVETGVFGQKVQRLNLDRWTDLEARSTFEASVDRWTRRIIQENDIGMMHRMFSHPFVQIVSQFRTFMLGAWAKQFLHNIHVRDFATVSSFAATTVSAGLAYVAQTYAQSVGRGDQQKFLEKRLDPKQIGLNAWQRTGWSSIMPMLLDSGSMISGNDPLFSGRTTQLPSNAVFGNPTANLVDSLKGFGEVGGAVLTGRTPSQQEMRSLWSVLPFQNFLPAQATFSALISGNPARQPKTHH